MVRWRFFDYAGTDGRNRIAEWYAAQEPEVRAAFDVTLQILRATEDWVEPPVVHFKSFHKAHKGLSEIRFYIDEPRPGKHPTRRRFRAIGIHRPSQGDFVLLVGCEERGMNYIPADALEEAMRAKSRFEQGLGWIHERS